jgi:hypothetical protein
MPSTATVLASSPNVRDGSTTIATRQSSEFMLAPPFLRRITQMPGKILSIAGGKEGKSVEPTHEDAKEERFYR